MFESISTIISIVIIAVIIFAGILGFCYFIEKNLELMDVEDRRD